MIGARDHNRVAVNIVLGSLFVALVGALLYCRSLLPQAADLLVSKIPIGSGVSQLNAISHHELIRASRVVQWLPISPIISADHARQYGAVPGSSSVQVHHKDLGSFDDRNPPKDAQYSFTGEIMFMTDNELLVFRFRDGKLVERGWGYLPG